MAAPASPREATAWYCSPRLRRRPRQRCRRGLFLATMVLDPPRRERARKFPAPRGPVARQILCEKSSSSPQILHQIELTLRISSSSCLPQPRANPPLPCALPRLRPSPPQFRRRRSPRASPLTPTLLLPNSSVARARAPLLEMSTPVGLRKSKKAPHGRGGGSVTPLPSHGRGGGSAPPSSFDRGGGSPALPPSLGRSGGLATPTPSLGCGGGSTAPWIDGFPWCQSNSASPFPSPPCGGDFPRYSGGHDGENVDHSSPGSW